MKTHKKISIILAILTLFISIPISKTYASNWQYNGIDILYDVVSPNSAPTVDAGSDQAITAPTDSAVLSGAASDSDGTVDYTIWQFVSGPATAVISGDAHDNPNSVSVSGMTVAGTYLFRLNAQDDDGAWGWDEMQVVLTDPLGGPSGTLSATDCTISVGSSTCSTTVSWTTSNLTIFGTTEITRSPNGPAPFTPSPLAAGSQGVTIGHGVTIFYLYHNAIELAQDGMIASCDIGSSWDGSTCLATPPGTPSVNLNAAPTSIFSGSTSTLSWTSANVTSCTASAIPASGSWTGARPTASAFPHESTGALTATKTFTLTCTGPGGSAFSSKTVTVVPITTNIFAELTATPDRIVSGGSSTLSWTSTNATSCSGIGFATGGLTSGSIPVSPTVNTTYTLTCTNGSDSASDQASVTLRRKFLFIEF